MNARFPLNKSSGKGAGHEKPGPPRGPGLGETWARESTFPFARSYLACPAGKTAMSNAEPTFQEGHARATPIRDLGLKIAGTRLEPIVTAFEAELRVVG